MCQVKLNPTDWRAELDYKPDIDIIYTSSEASGGSWRLSDDQTKCLNSPEIDSSQPNRHTDRWTDRQT